MSLFQKKYLFQEIAEKQREYRLPYSNIPNYIVDKLRNIPEVIPFNKPKNFKKGE